MRAIVPYIFWPWFATSCFILLRRRVTTGGWKPMPSDDDMKPLPEFPPLPAESRVAEPTTAFAPAPPDHAPVEPAAADEPSADRATAPVAVDTEPRPRSQTLADALSGITMPADLAPLIGNGDMNPREIVFFTNGHPVSTVGTAIGDELERLGFALTPLDDATLNATRGQDVIRARIMGGDVTHPDVMQELHPSAPAGAVVVELKLT